MQRADAARRAQEQEMSLSDQRRGHIEAEYEMYLRKEQLRIDFVSESQTMHSNAMHELEKAIAEVDATRNQTLEERDAIDTEIQRCNEAIKKFQELTSCGGSGATSSAISAMISLKNSRSFLSSRMVCGS